MREGKEGYLQIIAMNGRIGTMSLYNRLVACIYFVSTFRLSAIHSVVGDKTVEACKRVGTTIVAQYLPDITQRLIADRFVYIRPHLYRSRATRRPTSGQSWQPTRLPWRGAV